MHDLLPLILASSSPRRQELIALLGLPFTILPSQYVEPPLPVFAVDLAAYVVELAANKARETASRVSRGFVLGADTIVALDDRIGIPLGKPRDAEDAQRMLRMLSGKTHSVYTGIALIPIDMRDETPIILTSAARTLVRFRELNDSMIEDYIATGEPMDKAGAYGAQGYAAPFIESFDGDFFNVVGLPLSEVARLLEKSGFEWWKFRSLTYPQPPPET